MKKVLDYIKDLLRYPSTYQGIVILAGLIGITLSPEQAQMIIGIAAGAVGLIQTFLSDSDVKPLEPPAVDEDEEK